MSEHAILYLMMIMDILVCYIYVKKNNTETINTYIYIYTVYVFFYIHDSLVHYITLHTVLLTAGNVREARALHLPKLQEFGC